MVDHELSPALVANQIRFLENRQMTGDCRLREAESADDFTDGVLPVLQESQNLAPRLVRESLEELAEVPAACLDIWRNIGEGFARHVAG